MKIMNKYSIKFILIEIIIGILFFVSKGNVYAKNDDIKLIYFYSPTCSSCQNLSSLFNDLKKEHPNLIIRKYNITNLKSKSLMNKYNKTYKVNEEDEDIVPVVFIKDIYLTGEQDISNNLESIIIKKDGIQTIDIKDTTENFDSDIKLFMNFKVLGIFVAGLANGINPCSMSMLLFFIFLNTVRKESIMKLGFAFSIGNFLAYLLLGTIFFSILSRLNIGYFQKLIKITILVLIILIIILNILDYFAAKNERYNKIYVQLPLVLRKFNHSLIKKYRILQI